MNAEVSRVEQEALEEKRLLQQRAGEIAEARDTRIAELNTAADRLRTGKPDVVARLHAESTEQIAEIEEKIDAIRQAEALKNAAVLAANQLRVDDLVAERDDLRRRTTEQFDAISQDRDSKIAALERSARSGAEIRSLIEANDRTIVDAKAEIANLKVDIADAYKESFVYQLARIVSGRDTPSKSEVSWTLRVLLPIVAFLIAIIPWVGFKLSLYSLTQRRREGTLSSLRKKVSRRADKKIEDMRRQLEIADKQAVDARADTEIVRHSFEKKMAAVKEEAADQIARSQRVSEEKSRRAEERVRATQHDARQQMERALAEAEQKVTAADEDRKYQIHRLQVRIREAEEKASCAVSQADARIQKSVAVAREECDTHIANIRERADSDARRGVRNQLAEQDQSIGRLEGTVSNLTRENKRLSMENDSLVRDVNELRAKIRELVEKPIAKIYVDNRVKEAG